VNSQPANKQDELLDGADYLIKPAATDEMKKTGEFEGMVEESKADLLSNSEDLSPGQKDEYMKKWMENTPKPKPVEVNIMH